MPGENFPVALRVLPASLRADLRAIYAYARFVDQLGDAYRGDRSAALDWLEAEVDRGLSGAFPPAELHPSVGPVVSLVTRRGSGGAQLTALIAANRMDQTVSSYDRFDDLVAYCHLSADPVGRLVLVACERSTSERVAWSDRICTALQLAEHWQDLAEDARAGRVYLPVEDLERFGVERAEIERTAGPGGQASSRLRGLVAFEVFRARSLLREGEALVRSLDGWARLAVAGFVAGGHGALDAIADAGYDPFPGPPRPARRRVVAHAVRLLAASRAGQAATGVRVQAGPATPGGPNPGPADPCRPAPGRPDPGPWPGGGPG